MGIITAFEVVVTESGLFVISVQMKWGKRR
jgi:hypothetical protein